MEKLWFFHFFIFNWNKPFCTGNSLTKSIRYVHKHKISKNQIIRHPSLKLKRCRSRWSRWKISTISEQRSWLFFLLYKHRMKVVVQKRATCICTLQVQQNLMSDLVSYIFETINNEERKWQKHFTLQGLEREKMKEIRKMHSQSPWELFIIKESCITREKVPWMKQSGRRKISKK